MAHKHQKESESSPLKDIVNQFHALSNRKCSKRILGQNENIVAVIIISFIFM